MRKTIGIKRLLKEAIYDIMGIESAFNIWFVCQRRKKAVRDIDLCIIRRIDEDQLIAKKML